MNNFRLALLLLLSSGLSAQQLSDRPSTTQLAAPKPPNTNAVYQQLRNVIVSGETATVTGLELKRDIATFTFTSGTFYFLQPVNGKVTGAVFLGSGSVKMEPVNPLDRRVLQIYDKTGYGETFSSLVIRFTDDTYEEIKKKFAPVNGTAAGVGEFQDTQDRLRHYLHYNLDGRILQDVLSSQPGGLFWAFIKGKKHGDKQLFQIDPQGVTGFAFGASYPPFNMSGFLPQRLGPEEVLFQTYSEDNEGIWVCEHFASEYTAQKASGSEANEVIDISKHVISTSIEKNARLSGDDTITFSALQDEVAVVPFQLFSHLRVQSVSGPDGQALEFIQEGEKDDWGFYVVLPRPRRLGEQYTLRTTYSGKDAITNEGGGNYNVSGSARDSWYPNTYFGDYADYQLTFKVPKKMKVAATGKLVREVDEGNSTISEWATATPITVAGLSLGHFKTESAKAEKANVSVTAFANDDQPDWVKSLNNWNSRTGEMNFNRPGGDRAALGTMSTVPLLKKNLAEAQLATELYTAFFGKASATELAVTQQTPCTYGQAWPGLVYLPVCAFFDTTVRNALGLTDTRGYWEAVGPHEVAHQWWGHTVGWDSYRDQWMSEGFAELSASIFLQTYYKQDKYLKFWRDELQLLTEPTRTGFRGIDLPLTLGYRLATPKTGYDIPRRLIYPKGGFILHMLRMMMFDRQTGDKQFSDMMKDFVETYRNKPATTEDFKTMVEKHMTTAMDLDGNHKMDWFFDPYVYGTVLPEYRFEHTIRPNGPGQFVLHMRVTQAKVPETFKMIVPVYLELANGTQVRLGTVPIVGNRSVDADVPLPLKEAPRRALINANYDVLALQP